MSGFTEYMLTTAPHECSSEPIKNNTNANKITEPCEIQKRKRNPNPKYFNNNFQIGSMPNTQKPKPKNEEKIKINNAKKEKHQNHSSQKNIENANQYVTCNTTLSDSSNTTVSSLSANTKLDTLNESEILNNDSDENISNSFPSLLERCQNNIKNSTNISLQNKSRKTDVENKQKRKNCTQGYFNLNTDMHNMPNRQNNIKQNEKKKSNDTIASSHNQLILKDTTKSPKGKSKRTNNRVFSVNEIHGTPVKDASDLKLMLKRENGKKIIM